MSKTIPARQIKQGNCFRKRTGEYVYLRISDSSVRFLKLDPNKVYGVCYNGNVAILEPDKDVVPMPMSAMSDNRSSEENWDKTFALPCGECGGFPVDYCGLCGGFPQD